MEGWLYLAVIVDLRSRRVVGWSMSQSLEESIVLDALAWHSGVDSPVAVYSLIPIAEVSRPARSSSCAQITA